MKSTQSNEPVPASRAASRFGRRVEVSLSVEVAGCSGVFGAQTVDISRTGVLLYLVDEQFVPTADAANMILYSERVEEEFGDGLEVRLGTGLHFEAEVVRVARREDGRDEPMIMACRYACPMTDEEWDSLGFLEEVDSTVEHEEITAALAAASEIPAANRRDRPRSGTRHAVEILSEYAAYRAVAVNLSRDGVLLEMTDPAFFAGGDGADRLEICTDRLSVQFGNGMRIRFRDADVAVDAEIVRVGEKQRDGGATVVVGCQFQEPLGIPACRRLNIALPESVLGEPGGEPSQTRVSELLVRARAVGATDLHLKSGSPPRVRVGGTLVQLEEDSLDEVETEAMALELEARPRVVGTSEHGYRQFVSELAGVGRFRVQALRRPGHVALAVRCLPMHPPALDDLDLPADVGSLASLRSGLVLISGRARSGRTTLLAALVDQVNRTRPCHIVTVEETVEFAHRELAAHITQRDLGEESTAMSVAIGQTLHLDADVVAIGGLGSAESLDAALEAAESGRLVFATTTGADAGDTLASLLRLVPEERRATLQDRFSRSLCGLLAVELEHDQMGRPQLQCILHRHKSEAQE